MKQNFRATRSNAAFSLFEIIVAMADYRCHGDSQPDLYGSAVRVVASWRYGCGTAIPRPQR